jgi:hypothetical protein
MPWTPITAAAAAVSFWLTVALAATGSLLSALCILDPVSEPKRDPYFFIGQWFTWLATPLLWGAVVASLASEWLQPFDLLLPASGACLPVGSASGVQPEVEREEPMARSQRGVRHPAAAALMNTTAVLVLLMDSINIISLTNHF